MIHSAQKTFSRSGDRRDVLVYGVDLFHEFKAKENTLLWTELKKGKFQVKSFYNLCAEN